MRASSTSTSPTRTCQACWSAVPADAVTCEHCGTTTAPPRRRGPRLRILLLALLLVAGGLPLLWLWGEGEGWSRSRSSSDSRDENIQATAGVGVGVGQREARRAENREAAGESEAAESRVQEPQHQTLTPAHWQLYASDGSSGKRPVALLALVASHPRPKARWRHYCLPLALLPKRGALQTESGEEPDLQVVTVDWRSGMVLLLLAGPEGPEPLQAAAASLYPTGSTFTALGVGGQDLGELSFLGGAGGGPGLQLSRSLPQGAAILDQESRVLAYALGGRQALAVEPLLGWLDRYQGTDLAQAQEQIRARDPVLLLEDARDLLRRDPATSEQVAAAILKLEAGQHLARRRETLDAYDQTMRFAHHQRVRLLEKVDEVQALKQARQSLALFPDHAGILGDAVILSLSGGVPQEALGLYRRLLAISQDHALKVRNELLSRLKQVARTCLRDGRYQEALELLAEAIRLFPTRPDLRLAYAQGLSKAGRHGPALVQAEEAARLDPSYQGQLPRYRRSQKLSTQKGVVTIPFDPKTRIISTKASLAGEEVSLIVDTGASLVTVPTAVADRLGLRKPKNPRVKVTTAGGEVEAEMVVLPWLQIGKLRLRSVQAVVLDLPGSLGGKGLLGLNVLQRLNMQIDSENSRLILRRSRRRR